MVQAAGAVCLGHRENTFEHQQESVSSGTHPMRLAVYIRSVRTARGAEQVSANVARGLAELGHQVDFLVEDDQGWLLDKLRRHANISVIDLRDAASNRFMHRWYQLQVLLRSLLMRCPAVTHADRSWPRLLLRMLSKNDPPVFSLCRYLAAQRPVSILSYLNDSNLNLMLAALVCRADTRYLPSVRNHISTASQKIQSKWLRSVPILMRRYFRLADLVVAPSAGIGADVMAITGLPAGRIAVVHNPVFRPEIIELSRQPVDHPWLRDSTVPVLVAAGKFKPQKDFATLLKAFARLREKRPLRLLILGEGAERSTLEQLVNQLGITADVDMPGYVENPYPYFRQAAVFVLSSAWEGLPNVLIEAMACGCPVVATDCPSGPGEILEQGRIGKLVPVGDVTAMAGAIDATLDAPAPRELFVERAKHYSYDGVVADYARVLTGSSTRQVTD
jgi:glycosyltransferase involved in cell wall biosynthesis